MSHWNISFDALLDGAFFLVLGSFLYCLATLRLYVDEGKVRSEENIASLFKNRLLPERVLTEAGRRRVKLAKGFFVIGGFLFGIIYCRFMLS